MADVSGRNREGYRRQRIGPLHHPDRSVEVAGGRAATTLSFMTARAAVHKLIPLIAVPWFFTLGCTSDSSDSSDATERSRFDQAPSITKLGKADLAGWDGESCDGEPINLTFGVGTNQVVEVGPIPGGRDVLVELTSDEDLDINLSDEDGTVIVGWPDGLLNGPTEQSLTDRGVELEWSGFRGGEEVLSIRGAREHTYNLGVFGFSGGSATLRAEITCHPRPVALASSSESDHTCALMDNGAVSCWGNNFGGELGYGNGENIGDDETPAEAGHIDIGATATQIATGFRRTCALLDGGAVRCWGSNANGELGYGHTNTIGDDETPSSVGNVDLGGAIASQLTLGGFHTCALVDRGGVRCWGEQPSGELGYGNTRTIGDDETPRSVGTVNLGGIAIQITAGSRHTCALLNTGTIRCWGEAQFGALGYDNIEDIGDNEVPRSAGDVDVGGPAESVRAGSFHTCALLQTGAVRCWGDGSFGALGYGNTDTIGDDETPASVGDVDIGGTAIALTAGGNHTCVALDTGAVRCWGSNENGQLGHGNIVTLGDDEVPAVVGDVSVGEQPFELTAGRNHNCALLDRGAVRCWGDVFSVGLGVTEVGDPMFPHVGDDEVPSDVGELVIRTPLR